jgi:hypothetical protein
LIIGIDINAENQVIVAYSDEYNGTIHVDVDESTFDNVFKLAVPYRYENDELIVDTNKQQIDSLNTEIADLQSKLNDPLSVDKVTEALEYKLRDEAIPDDLQQVLDDRQSWRDQINTLQIEIESLI